MTVGEGMSQASPSIQLLFFPPHKYAPNAQTQECIVLLNFNENTTEILGVNDHLARIQLVSTLSAPVLPAFFLQ